MPLHQRRKDFGARASQRPAHVLGKVRSFGVDFDDFCSLSNGQRDQSCGGVDLRGGSGHDEDIGCEHCSGGGFDGSFGELLSEPDYGGSQHGSAFAVRREVGEGFAVCPRVAAADAADFPDISVEADDVL